MQMDMKITSHGSNGGNSGNQGKLNRLAEVMREGAVSINDLADELKMPRKIIQELRKPETNFRLSLLLKLAEALEVKPQDLIIDPKKEALAGFTEVHLIRIMNVLKGLRKVTTSEEIQNMLANLTIQLSETFPDFDWEKGCVK